MNDNDPTFRARARAKLRAWIVAGCPDDQASLDALDVIELTDEDLEAMFGAIPPRRLALVPHGGPVR